MSYRENLSPYIIPRACAKKQNWLMAREAEIHVYSGGGGLAVHDLFYLSFVKFAFFHAPGKRCKSSRARRKKSYITRGYFYFSLLWRFHSLLYMYTCPGFVQRNLTCSFCYSVYLAWKISDKAVSFVKLNWWLQLFENRISPLINGIVYWFPIG